MAAPAAGAPRRPERAPLGVCVRPALGTPVVMGVRRALRNGLTALVALVALIGLTTFIALIPMIPMIPMITFIALISLVLLVQLVLRVLRVLRVLLIAPPASFPCRAGPLTPTTRAPVGHRASQRNAWSTEKSGHVAISSTLAQRRASGIPRRRPSTPVRHRAYTPPAPSSTGLTASPITRTSCLKHMACPRFSASKFRVEVTRRTTTDTGREVSLLTTTLRIPYRIMPNAAFVNVLDSPCAPKVIFTAKRTDPSRIIRNDHRVAKGGNQASPS
ncbi:hypothetical protein CFP59_04534 [Streptomyces malaysiensis subsp. malaysiensis]|uniref:hypothetical protein n=1 Tax=Streptomyces malaysiensis TaxID=92644 RepID=UPI000CA3C158|nr:MULTISPECIES: hypothetical protein [unclassified Streptomyces]AUA12394.1 hypothetical protein CFP59_04534 [Streptomyces sp. M56]